MWYYWNNTEHFDTEERLIFLRHWERNFLNGSSCNSSKEFNKICIRIQIY